MRVFRYLFVALLATLLTTSVGFSADKASFHATLSGGEAVPQVKTMAKGKAEFKLSKDGKELMYTLSVSDLENVIAAHIHQGKKGTEGPPVAGLFAGPKKEGKFSGVLAKGAITEKDLMGSVAGTPLKSLVELIKSGDAYVNVHTDKHPEGELRGQIK